MHLCFIIIIKAINYTCYSSLLIHFFDFFQVIKTSTNEPAIQTPIATQVEGAIPTQVEASTTQLEAVAATELPLVPPCKVSMTVPVSSTCSDRKKSVVWGHFEKNKDRRG